MLTWTKKQTAKSMMSYNLKILNEYIFNNWIYQESYAEIQKANTADHSC